MWASRRGIRTRGEPRFAGSPKYGVDQEVEPYHDASRFIRATLEFVTSVRWQMTFNDIFIYLPDLKLHSS
jgi:hypothetical protein